MSEAEIEKPFYDKEDDEYFDPSQKTSLLANKKAKRDHIIVQNDFRADIKKGESLNGIPDRFYETLKAEKVI